MEDRADTAECVGILIQQIEQGIGLHVVVEAKRGEILPLRILTQHVGDEDVLLAALVEGMDEGAADEAGSSSDKNGCGHGCGIRRSIASPKRESSWGRPTA